MGLFGALLSGVFGLMQAQTAADAQRDVAAYQWDASKKRTAAENMRNAGQMEKQATRDVMDQGFKSTQLQQGAFNSLMDVMRDTYLRQTGMRKQ
jgi:hypothetical protein